MPEVILQTSLLQAKHWHTPNVAKSTIANLKESAKVLQKALVNDMTLKV
jgi:hypothetical protein